jgi:hypothetical protein
VLVLSIVGTIWLLFDSPYDETRTLAFLALGVLFAWRAIRGLRLDAASREETEVFERAAELEHVDPAAADQLLSSYFTKKGELAARERARLWEMASHDRGSAARLERLLKADLRGNALMRQRWIPTVPSEQRSAAAQMVEKRERQTREDLERVHVILKQLKA